MAKILNVLDKSYFLADAILSTRNSDLHEAFKFLYRLLMLMRS